MLDMSPCPFCAEFLSNYKHHPSVCAEQVEQVCLELGVYKNVLKGMSRSVGDILSAIEDTQSLVVDMQIAVEDALSEI